MSFAVYKASACQFLQPGDLMNKDDIIEYETNIVLVKAYRDAERQPLKFQIKEILKGDPQIIDKLLEKYKDNEESFHPTPIKNDFNGHKDQEFWHDNIGRSFNLGSSCSPSYIFKEGETYLLFPELYAARQSAEEIDSTDDLWYRYVKRRIKEVADLTVTVHFKKNDDIRLNYSGLLTFPTTKLTTATTFLSTKMKYRLMDDPYNGEAWNRNSRDVINNIQTNDISLKQQIFSGRYFLYLEVGYNLPKDWEGRHLGCYISAKSFKITPNKRQVYDVIVKFIKSKSKMTLNCLM